MKRLKISLIAAAAALLIGGASFVALADNNTPASALTSYYEEAKNGNVEKAKQYLSSDILKAHEIYPWMGAASTEIPKDGRKYKKVEPLEETAKINGESAQMKVKLTHKDDTKTTETYNFIKEEGKWKITFRD